MNWLIAGLIVGPILYILITLYTPRLRSVDDYQFGERNLNPSDVVDASIMYGLQIAAIALFATWGFQFGLTALVVPAFWAVGYVIFALMLSNDFLGRFVQDNRFRTLHGFLADHGKVRSVRLVAALLTLIGLAGPAMVEAFTVGRSVAAAVPDFGAPGGVGLAIAFLAVSLIYMTRSGFPGVVRLNQFQMVVGYGGFCIALAGIMVWSIGRVGPSVIFNLSVGGMLTTIAIGVLKVWHDIASYRYVSLMLPDEAPKQTHDILGLSAVMIGIGSFAVAAVNAATSDVGTVAAVAWFGTGTGTSNGYGFTLFATVSLFIANAFYQFVDITQWQRLLSIAVDQKKLSETAKVLRSNVVTGGICSSMTWVLAILFGIFLRSLFPAEDTDAYGLLPALLSELLVNSAETGFLLFILVAALLAIMFSTLDAVVAATAFTVQEDVIGIENGRGSLGWARAITVFVVILQFAFYIAVSTAAGDRVDAILYICWSFQLAMLPTVVALLSGRGGSFFARVASMLAGCVGALSPLIFGAPEKAYEISPTAAVLAATTFYLLFGGWRKPSLAGAK